MSRFPNQHTALKQIWDELRTIKARLYSISTPSSGKLRVTSTTIAGGTQPHDHTNLENGSHPQYTPELLSDWSGNQDPGDIWDALDQLARRLKTIEDVIIGIPPIVYPANTMIFNGME